ncbi:hypothetical protein HGRIS_013537 [Hohenbuehelia grisea]|uniref:Uncharacterized protein n=1 Tax=Hohenbuehelia grisea TaxID=104357 RepID=A0ABR3IVV0_9AGAR
MKEYEYKGVLKKRTIQAALGLHEHDVTYNAVVRSLRRMCDALFTLHVPLKLQPEARWNLFADLVRFRPVPAENLDTTGTDPSQGFNALPRSSRTWPPGYNPQIHKDVYQ